MNKKREFKDAIYSQIARIGKAMSSPKRLELLDILSQSPKTVETLARETEMSVANVSQHLQTLREAHLVESSKQGNFVFYRLSSQAIATFLIGMRNVAEEQIIEIQSIYDQFFSSQDPAEPITSVELLDRLKKGSVTLLDVRPKEEYAADHIPTAISIPIDELEDQLVNLPQDQEIIAYCRGRYCVYSLQAINLLRSRGYKAVRLENGVQEWKQADFPLEGESNLH
ncbi:ArsR/SmtB family transcription factor [Ectobacillus sp. sgz5001026]|uniref:ArsR/SmtB family transcription factor n=1 Tax=Ectobacillus sp. sgz5001026 TaxID=3242473 RepID=UPI0036D256FF